ncbi:MurR/RpiR family transcriptional regulator [Clostridium sp. Cult3]|uniref:MurR/RpiR family transcriptional regulator n=1 Tax=Clostridium sp. Cult3 TaxID=2079004 RepID=UPI001F3DBD91|nr:MurR/RpiR family transcriptional regulator [Clostridium sp. Cult3]MCF6459731.1 N-acetylmannosamine kinase [Clostridium sp. Cult3]
MEKYVDLIKVIQNNFNTLSKGQKLIAEYIMDNYDKAAFMTAATLGETVGVSESTVVRFANTLGYDGYRELQKELQELIKNKLTTVQRISLSKDFSDYENALKQVVKKDMDNIEKTLNEIDYQAFQKAVEITLEADNVFILGLRSSSFLAGYLGFYLNFLLDNVKIISSGPNDVFEQLLKATEEDVIIGISYPRYSKRTLEALDYGREKGCNIIGITDSLVSPAAQYADVTLISSSNMLSFVDSLVAPMSLINAFIVALGMEKKEEITTYFEDLETIWKKHSVYDTNNKNRN